MLRCFLAGFLAVPFAGSLAFAQQPSPAAAPPPPAVKIGEPAPDFSLPYLVPKPDGGVETKQVALSDFKGKQNVILAFFPAAFSPG